MILEMLSSTVVGSIVGTIGGWLKQREERENLKLTLSHQFNMAVENNKAKVDFANVKGELKVQEKEATAFTESQKETTTVGANIKSAFRPLITSVILSYAGYIIYQLDKSVGISAFTPEEQASLYRLVVLQIFGLLGTVVGWWFASRDTKTYKVLLDKFL